MAYQLAENREVNSIDRAAVTIKFRQPFVDWLNSMPGDDCDYTLERLASNNLTFLIPEQNSPESTLTYVRRQYSFIFEWELWGWITKEEYWPKNRTWKMFLEWFDIEISSEVFDLVKGEIEREEV